MLLYCFLGDCRWKKRDWARSVGETFADLPTKVLPSGFRVGGVHFVSNHKTKLFNGAPLVVVGGWVDVFVLGIELKVTSAKLLLSLLLLAMFLLNLNFQVDLPQLHPSAIPETICRDVWT